MKIEEEIKQQSQWSSANQKAVVNLLYTASWLQNKQHAFFKPYGITNQQYNILRILRGQIPKSISASEIKARMIDKNSDVSRLLDRLEAKELIVKQTSKIDKRATEISISEAGLGLLKQIQEKQHILHSLLILTEEEATFLSDLLDRARG